MKTLFTSLLFSVSTLMAWSQGASLPYYSGFDTPQEQAGWMEYRTGFNSTSDWGVGGTQGFGGTACLGHDYNVGGGANDTVIDWFVSPTINFSSPTKISLKVFTNGFSTPFPDNCDIWFGTGNQNPALGNFVLIGNVSYMTPQFTWLDTSFNISNLSDSGFIAIKYKTIGAAWMTYNIDNINIAVDSTLSIKENSPNVYMQIFPNPFYSTATISIDDKLISSQSELQITDTFGKEIRRIKSIGNNKIILSSENLSAGCYILNLFNENKLAASRKFSVE